MNLIDSNDILKASKLNRFGGNLGGSLVAKLVMYIMRLNKINKLYSDVYSDNPEAFLEQLIEALGVTIEVNEEDLFAKGSGYRNALNGIYLNMSDNSLYGRNLSYGFIEVLGHQYLPEHLKNTGSYYKTYQFLYDDTDVKSFISAMWSKGYNVIASCNNLIHNISEADAMLFDGVETVSYTHLTLPTNSRV